jgi:hypothetical protein
LEKKILNQNEFKNKFNHVWVDEEINCAYLKHISTGKTAVFDVDCYYAVVQSILDYGNWYYLKNNDNFFVSDKKRKVIYNLRQLIYATKNDIPIEVVSDYFVSNISDDALDYRVCNMEVSYPSKVMHDGKHIFIEKDGETTYADYEPKLFQFLSSKRWYYNKTKKVFNMQTKQQEKFKLHHILFCYYMGVLPQNIESGTRILQIMMKQADCTIDHKNSDKMDNTKANLQYIPRSLNAKKSNITARQNLKSNQFYEPIIGGELCGRIDYKQGIWSKLAEIINCEPTYDLELLPPCGDIETSIDNLCNFLRKDEMPDDTIKIKNSTKQYTRAGITTAIIGVALWEILEDTITKNINKRMNEVNQ